MSVKLGKKARKKVGENRYAIKKVLRHKKAKKEKRHK